MSSTISRHMRPRHKAVSRALGFALTTADYHGWRAFAATIEARLTTTERAALAYSAMRSQPQDQAEVNADAAINGTCHQTPPSFIDTPRGRAAIVEWRDQRDGKRRRAA